MKSLVSKRTIRHQTIQQYDFLENLRRLKEENTSFDINSNFSDEFRESIKINPMHRYSYIINPERAIHPESQFMKELMMEIQKLCNYYYYIFQQKHRETITSE